MNIKFTLIAKFNDGAAGNYFSEVPNDLRRFLEANEGILSSVIDHLEPGDYEISVGIRPTKQEYLNDIQHLQVKNKLEVRQVSA